MSQVDTIATPPHKIPQDESRTTMKETSHRCSYEELLDLWTDPEGTTVDQVLQGTVRLLPSLLSDTAARNIRHGCPFQEEAIQARIVIVDAPCESDHEGPLTDCACPVYWSSSRGDEDLEGMVHLSAVIPSPFQSPIGKMQVFMPGPLESDRSEEGEEEEPMGNAITQRLEDLAKRLGRVLANGWKLEDRNKTIKALQAKERRLVESQIIARIGQWELDLTTNHLRWSDEIYNLFQIDKEKFGASYEAFLNAIHPDDRAFVDQAYTNSLKTKQPYKILHRLLFADGSTRWVQESCRTEYDAHTGKPLYSVGIVQDITELKQAQELDRLKVRGFLRLGQMECSFHRFSFVSRTLHSHFSIASLVRLPREYEPRNPHSAQRHHQHERFAARYGP